MSAAKNLISSTQEMQTKGLTGAHLVDLAINQKISHVSQEDGYLFADENEISRKLMASGGIDWINPIYNIFAAKDLNALTINLNKNANKQAIIQNVEHFLEENKVKQTLLQDLCLAVEETMSNVLMHAAPHVQDNHIGQLQVAHDIANSKVGFVCQDFAGKMNIDKMLNKIQKCYLEGVGNSISMTTKGAGIGTFLVFDGAGSYFLFNKADVSAFVGASYPVMSDKKRLAFSKHYHIGNE